MAPGTGLPDWFREVALRLLRLLNRVTDRPPQFVAVLVVILAMILVFAPNNSTVQLLLILVFLGYVVYGAWRIFSLRAATPFELRIIVHTPRGVSDTVEDARVTMRGAINLTQNTDPNGVVIFAYSRAELRNNVYVKAEHPDFGSSGEEYEVLDARRQPILLELKPAGQSSAAAPAPSASVPSGARGKSYTLTLTVYQGDRTDVVPNAKVVVTGGLSDSDTTNARGQVSFDYFKPALNSDVYVKAEKGFLRRSRENVFRLDGSPETEWIQLYSRRPLAFALGLIPVALIVAVLLLANPCALGLNCPQPTPTPPPGTTPAPTLTTIPTEAATTPPASSPTTAPTSISTSISTSQPIPTPIGTRMRDGVEMVVVPAGCFRLGSIESDRAIAMSVGYTDDEFNYGLVAAEAAPLCFTEQFLIDRYEVSNAQFERLGGKAENDTCFGTPSDTLPRTCITWVEARDYCLSRNARLPSEAEWVYAARGPENLNFPWGNRFEPSRVVFQETSNSPVPVDGPPYGLSWVGAAHMSGNVWEWTSTIGGDNSAKYPYDLTVTPADMSALGWYRIARGGSWRSDSKRLRVTWREWFDPLQPNTTFGVRCAADISA